MNSMKKWLLTLYITPSILIGTYVSKEKDMAPHSSTLAWKIPWMEEPGRLQSMVLQRVRHDWATSLSLFTFMHWRRKWQPTLVLLPGKSHGRRSLVGYCPWGHKELDTTEQLLFTSLRFIPPKSWPVGFFLGPLTLQPPLGGSHWFLWPQSYQCTDVFKICTSSSSAL